MDSEFLLEMVEISKNYGGIHALSNVSLRLKKGEIHCLVGENGAGKSTLIKILSGAEYPSAGEIYYAGGKAHISSPRKAHELGISTVYQELIQIPELSITENIYMSRYPKKAGLVDFKLARKQTLKLMDELEIHFDPGRKIKSMSIAERQLVEIMKAVSYDSRIIIFDEPTSSLTMEETELLFRIIKKLKDKGVSIIYISHRLEEVFRIGDFVTVLRDGKNVGSERINNITIDKLISMMVGRTLENQFPKDKHAIGDEVLRVESVSNQKLKNCSFYLRKGEILGFGGLVGAGRTELMRAVFGLDRADGIVYLNGKKVNNHNPFVTIKNGFALVPEDRKDQGLISGLSLRHNMILSSLPVFSRLGFMKSKKETQVSEDYIEKLRIRTPGVYQLVRNLSGGNQQKVVLARCLITKPQILILDEPTRGIDVGAKAEIYQIMNNLASQGVSIIMISSEMPELLAMSDRIIVMNEGRITGEVEKNEANEEIIMRLATKGGVYHAAAK